MSYREINPDNFLTPAQKANFISAWNRGVPIKNIMADLGWSVDSRTEYMRFKRLRRLLGLKPRKQAGYQRKQIVIMVDQEMHLAVKRRAWERETNSSGYIRALISRDLGQSA